MTNRRTPAKRPTRSTTWKPGRARSEIVKAVGAAAGVVVVTILLILILNPGDSGEQHRHGPGHDPDRALDRHRVDRPGPRRPPPSPRPPRRPRSHDRASPRPAFEAGLGFALDPFQREALDALDAGQSVLVAAPTGSGKTIVAEYAIGLALAEGTKAFYTTPLKALSNQKYGDLVRVHGPRAVGLLTGDNAVNGDAPIVVMTTEVLRNMIYAGSDALDGLRYVVLDEVHYLQNRYRGAVWEEVIIHLPPTVDLVCLSATVSNAEEFADWIRTVRGATTAIIEERRPVELTNLYAVGERGRRAHPPAADLHARARRRAAPEPGGVPTRRAGARPASAATRGRPRSRLFTPRRIELVDAAGRSRRCSRRSRSSSAGPRATTRSGSASPPGCA